MHLFIFFFFFQAEDGIRDPLVTGVQTCALPIFENAPEVAAENGLDIGVAVLPPDQPFGKIKRPLGKRSEERRVGKSVDLGGRRIIKKKKKKKRITDNTDRAISRINI